MNNLYVLPVANTTEERIQSQIDRFRRELIGNKISTDHIEEMLDIIIEYLSEYESHPFLEQAYIKINEANFWLSSFNDADID